MEPYSIPMRDLLVELTAFYSLEHIIWLIGKVLAHHNPRVARVSLNRLREQAQSCREIMLFSLPGMMFDYLALACLGEARHAYSCSNGIISEYDYSTDNSRHDVVCRLVGKVAPSDFLPKLITLFNEADWNSSFGGTKWGAIAQVALEFYNKQRNAITLLDNCVDLVHNGGLCFNKGFLLCCSDKYLLQRLLDDKASRKPLHKWAGSQRLGGEVWKIIRALQGHKIVNPMLINPMCVYCGERHDDYEDACTFMREGRHDVKSLADDGYIPVDWPSNNQDAEVVLGDVAIDSSLPPGHKHGGCDANGNEPCDGICDGCSYELTGSGCDANGNEPCDGDCSNCDYYHPGCDLNGNEQCDGECSECYYNKGGCELNDNEPCDGKCYRCKHQPEECTADEHAKCDGDCDSCEYKVQPEEEEEEEGETDDGPEPIVVDPNLQDPLFNLDEWTKHEVTKATLSFKTLGQASGEAASGVEKMKQAMHGMALALVSYGEVYDILPAAYTVLTELPQVGLAFQNDKMIFIKIA